MASQAGWQEIWLVERAGVPFPCVCEEARARAEKRLQQHPGETSRREFENENNRDVMRERWNAEENNNEMRMEYPGISALRMEKTDAVTL